MDDLGAQGRSVVDRQQERFGRKLASITSTEELEGFRGEMVRRGTITREQAEQIARHQQKLLQKTKKGQ